MVPTFIGDTTNGVNEILPGVSFHPTQPDLINGWRHTRDWRWRGIDNISDLAKWATKWCWSPIKWKDGYRCQDDFVLSDWSALDIDGDYDLAQACKDWCDTISIIMTTKSDSPIERRFRIFFMWEKRITSLDDYIFNSDLLARKYRSDDQTTDGARFFWPGKEIIQIVQEGFKQPVLSMPENYMSIAEKERRTLMKYVSMGGSGIFPQNIKAWLKGINVDGKRNNYCYSAAKYLNYWGMPHEKIEDMIISSNLPLKNYHSLREAKNAIRRGIKKAEKIKNISITKTSHGGDFSGAGRHSEPRELQWTSINK